MVRLFPDRKNLIVLIFSHPIEFLHTVNDDGMEDCA